MNARIAELIREDRADEIADAIADGAFFEMQTFTQALIDLVLHGRVDREIAANAATNRHDFLVALDQAMKRQAADKPTEEQRARAAADRARPRRLPELRLAARAERMRTRSRRGRRGARARRQARRAQTPSGDPRRRRRPARRSRTTRRSSCRRSLVHAARRPPRPLSYDQPAGALAAGGRGVRRSRGTCSPRSTRSSRTSAATWARARPARSAGCSSCRPPGCAGAPTRNGDGIADPWNADDAIYSAARYLAASGAATDIRQAVFSYNHARWYVNEVIRSRSCSARRARARPSSSTDCRSRSRPRGCRLADASSKLVDAQAARTRRATGGYERRLALVAGAQAPLGPARACAGAPSLAGVRRPRPGLAPPWQAAQAAGAARHAPRSSGPGRARRRRRSRRPPGRCSARPPTTAARSSRSAAARPSSRSRTSTTTIRPPTSRRPEGSPRVRARGRDRARELVDDPLRHRLRVRDGRRPALDLLPPVLPRPRRCRWARCSTAGASVGLVGHTGTRPARTCTSASSPPRYPQDQAWFQSFAGVAFTWQDAAPAERAVAAVAAPVRSGPVFAVMPGQPAERPVPAIGFTLQGG